MYIFQNVQIIDLCANNMILIPDNNSRNIFFISELKNIRKIMKSNFTDFSRTKNCFRVHENPLTGISTVA